MLFKQKHILKTYLPFLRNSRCFRISCPAQIRRPRNENRLAFGDLREERCFKNVDVQEKSSNSNFYGIESDEGVIIVDENRSIYVNQLTAPKTEKQKSEVYYNTSFGILRRDSENKLDYHGQYEETMSLEFKHHVAKTLPMSVANSPSTSSEVEHDQNSKSKFNSLQQSEVYTSAVNENIQFSNSVYHETQDSQTCNFKYNDISKLQVQSVLLNEDDVAQNQELELNCNDQLHFANYGEKLLNNEIKNTTISDVKDFNYIDEFYFSSSIDQSELDTSMSNHNRQSSDYLSHKDIVSHSSKEQLNGISEFPAMDKYKVEDISKNQEPGLNGTNQYYYSDSAEKLNIDEKKFVTSNIKKEFNYIDDYFQNSDMTRKSSILPDWNENSEIETSKINTINLEANKNISQHCKNVDSSRNYGVERTSYRTSLNHNDSKNVSENSLSNNKLSVNFKYFKGNRIDALNKMITDKNSDNFYESILKSPKQVNISVKAVQDERGSRLSSDYKKLTSDREARESLQHVLPNLQSKDPDKARTSSENNSEKTSSSTKKVETAFDFVSKIRDESSISHHQVKKGIIQRNVTKLDSKGFRILSNQVPDFSSYTRDEILDILVNSVLYADDDVVVLNKPYNLVMHESKTTKQPCLSTFLDDLAEVLDKKISNPKLFTVHRIDKETTGCLLLARSELAAQNLKSLFAQRKIMKTYWIVTIRIPEPLEGIIDIPIAEGTVEKKSRMVLQPDIPKDFNYKSHCKDGKRAVTRYKVISISGNAALVEVKPETGIKHQIRVHFGFGLSCPILGDHKYSHLTKLAPQKLSGELLQRLRVQQTKVRHIPMHIHARSILIPEYIDGRNLFVMAPLPRHMSQNMQSLKFKK